MTMPHSSKGSRARRRALQRQDRRMRGQVNAALARRRDRLARRAELHRRRYFRLSAPRLLELGERAGLVEDVPPPETNEGQDPALD